MVVLISRHLKHDGVGIPRSARLNTGSSRPTRPAATALHPARAATETVSSLSEENRRCGASGKKGCSNNLARLSLAIHLSVAALAAGTPTSVSAGPEDVPRGPYYLVKGLPAGATLSGGQTNAEHTWKVPLWALDDLKDDPKDSLKIEIPSGLSGNLDFVVALVGSDGAVFAKRTVALRVKSAFAATPSADAARGKQAVSTASKTRGATRAAELPGATINVRWPGRSAGGCAARPLCPYQGTS